MRASGLKATGRRVLITLPKDVYKAIPPYFSIAIDLYSVRECKPNARGRKRRKT